MGVFFLTVCKMYNNCQQIFFLKLLSSNMLNLMVRKYNYLRIALMYVTELEVACQIKSLIIINSLKSYCKNKTLLKCTLTLHR